MARILFLQGPLGPFFRDLADHFEQQNHQAFKVNFNAGDKLFSQKHNDFDFTARPNDWAKYLIDFIDKKNIDSIVVYGDCRFYHKVAAKIAKGKGINFWVFEEGYLRAGFVTLEQDGCNANSPLLRAPNMFNQIAAEPVKSKHIVGGTFKQRMWSAFRYYCRLKIDQKNFAHYQHHRPWTSWQECGYWLNNFKQKLIAKFSDPITSYKLFKNYDHNFYFLPLQVQVDFQLREHSNFDSVEQVIERVMTSFAKNSEVDQALLIKHHPQDRGFYHYRTLIKGLAQKLGVSNRVFYGHDLCLPSIYKHTQGVVTVNSTVGISALIHGLPTITLGEALYDIEGICYQNSLDEFWQAKFAMDKNLFAQFHTYLQQETQLSGDFYKDTGPLIASSYKKITEHTEQQKLLKTG